MGLTNGLIGTRILLVPKGESSRYADVQTVKDFRELETTGGFGVGWYDIDVWQRNDLQHVAVGGDWSVIFKMLENHDRGIDYFSRGATEIVANARDYPELEIEPRLALVYERDFIFYLSESNAQYRGALEKALLDMKREGEIEELLQKHMGQALGALNLDQRIRLQLQ